MKELLGEVVDRGLLLQSSEDQRVWLEELGEICDLVSSRKVSLMLGRAHPRMKKEGAIYRSAINVAVGAENADRIFRFKLELDNPVSGQRLVFLLQRWLTSGYYDSEQKIGWPVGRILG